MFAQVFGYTGLMPPIRYFALQECINSVQKFAFDRGLGVACPRIGTGRAGGKWSIIAPMILDEWTVYTLPNEVHLFEDKMRDDSSSILTKRDYIDED